MTYPPPTTIRFTEEDRAYLADLMKLTGLNEVAPAVRLAIREAVNNRIPKHQIPPTVSRWAASKNKKGVR